MGEMTPNKVRAEDRLAKCLDAMATIARAGEEFLAMRMVMVAGVNRDRIDQMIALNKATLAVVNKSLMICEDDLAREDRK